MYSPKIDEGLIPVLYRLAKERKIPMTRRVNELLQNAVGESADDLIGVGNHPEGNLSGSLR